MLIPNAFRSSLAVVVGAAALIAAQPTLAGPLDPPAGPVAPTRATVIDSLPYNVTQPGSYVFTQDLTGSGGLAGGLKIFVSDVTIDLNGFSLIGQDGPPQGNTAQYSGIIVENIGLENIEIRNGTIRDWGADGVFSFFGTSNRYINLRFLSNGTRGLHGGTNAYVEGCIATGTTGGDGIVVNGGSVIVDSIANGNNNGIIVQVGTGGVVRNCVAGQNNGNGITTFTEGVLIQGNSTTDNGVNGIEANRALIRGNISLNNTGANINQTGSTLFENVN